MSKLSSLLASDYFGVALVFYTKEIFCRGTERHKNIDFINCLTILRARKYGANTIEGTRRRERAGRRKVAKDAASTMLHGSQRRSHARERGKERPKRARLEGRERNGGLRTTRNGDDGGGRVEREKASGVGAVAMS